VDEKRWAAAKPATAGVILLLLLQVAACSVVLVFFGVGIIIPW